MTGRPSWMPRLGADTSDGRYRVVRRGLALVVGLRLAVGSYSDLAGQPDAHFRPPGILSWMDGVPSRGVLVAVQLLGITAALVATSGWGVRVADGVPALRSRIGGVVAAAAFPAAWSALLFLTAVRTSGGKIQHNDVLLLLAAVPLLLVPENRVRSGTGALAGPRRNVGWPLDLAVVVIALSYWFTGVAKLIHTGPAWAFSDNVRYVMYWAAQTPRPGIDWIPETLASQGALTRVVAVSALAFELAAPVVVFWRRARIPYAVGAVGLHLGTWAALGIDYWGWAATVAVVLVGGEVAGRRAGIPVPLPAGAGDGDLSQGGPGGGEARMEG